MLVLINNTILHITILHNIVLLLNNTNIMFIIMITIMMVM